MPVLYSWPLSSPPAPTASVDATDTAASLLASVPGRSRRGITLPFQRGANDFETGDGARLIDTAIKVVLGTRCSSGTTQGELPWRTAFGSLVESARHRNNNAVFEALLNQWTVDAISKWLTNVRVTRTTFSRQKDENGHETIAVLRVYWEAVALGGDVLGAGSTSVQLPAIAR